MIMKYKSKWSYWKLYLMNPHFNILFELLHSKPVSFNILRHWPVYVTHRIIENLTFIESRSDKCLCNVALKNKDDLLENDITFEVSNADRIILTDAKWMEFMLNQIVNNSIKYKDKTKVEPYIKMSAAEDKKCVVLEILDNGIGINGRIKE